MEIWDAFMYMCDADTIKHCAEFPNSNNVLILLYFERYKAAGSWEIAVNSFSWDGPFKKKF